MRTLVSVVVALALVSVAVVPASGGTLGPKKPSQIVSAACQGGPPTPTLCFLDPTHGVTYNADATFAPGFVIPPGQVLIVTSLNMTVCNGPPGGTACLQYYGPLDGPEARGVFDAFGCFTADKEYATGLVVKSGLPSGFGGNECATPNGTVRGRLNGYFVPDK